MKPVPPASLAKRTQEHLIRLISEGRWNAGLPAERQLALDLQVSRPVLREALMKLEEHGYLKRDKRRRRIPTRKLHETIRPRSALIVHPSERSSMPASTASMIRTATKLLTQKKVTITNTVCPELKLTEVGQALKQLHNQYPEDVWILRSPSIATLNWCAENHPHCVVIGTQPTPFSFPGVDLDITPVFHHSLSQCDQRNCQHVVFLTPAGMSPAKRLLIKFVKESSDPKRQTHIENIPNTNTELAVSKILHLLAARPRPDAFICTNFQHWLLAYSLLVEAGLSPTKDVFLLCHYPDPHMLWVAHNVPHYDFNWEQAGTFIANQALLNIEHPNTPTPEVLTLLPHFVETQKDNKWLKA